MANTNLIAEVISIDDPDKMGRSKIRIKGIHDDKSNIPDKDLPWAIPLKGSDDPCINKIGSGGNGLLVGSTVMIQFWDIGTGKQHPYIIGAIPKAGEEKSGSTTNGSTAIDTSKGDTPTASRSTDVNPVINNPIKDKTTTPGKKEDEGKNIFDEFRNKANLKDLPTIGTLLTPQNILKAISSVDAKNTSGIFSNSISSLNEIDQIDSVETPDNLNLIIAKVFADVLYATSLTHANYYVKNMLSNITSNTNPENIVSGEYLFSENEEYVQITRDLILEFSNLTEKKQETIILIEEGIIKDTYDSFKLVLESPIVVNVKANTLDKTKLLSLIQLALTYRTTATPSSSGTLSIDLSTLIGSLSTLTGLSLSSLTSTFTKEFSTLLQKEALINKMFSALSDNKNIDFSNTSSGITNPATGQ